VGIAAPIAPEQSRFPVKATAALIIGFFVLFVAVLSTAIVQARQEAQRAAATRAEAASQVVATNTKWIVELARQALQRIDGSLGPDINYVPGQTVQNIEDAVQGLPGTVQAYVFDAKGETLYSTNPKIRPITVTDREYFKAARSGTRWNSSSLLISKLDGKQIFIFAKRLERAGKFAGVAVVSYNVELFREIWASLGLSTSSSVSIIRKDGQLTARFPLPDGPLDMSDYALFTEYLPKSSEGVYPAVSPADGVSRFIAYRVVPDTDFIAVASVSAGAAYQLFWRNTLWLLGLSVPTAIALAVASLWIVRLARSGLKRQAELEEALRLNQLLFRDTHHRVKNNLQSVQSLVRMQNIPPESMADLQSRIGAMTAVHEHMYRLDQYSEIEAHELIPSIVEPLTQTFGIEAGILTEIEPLVIDRDFATPLALLINEVVTNALKYAFPDGRRGSIRISLIPTDNNMARLTITDDGIGFDPAEVVSGMGNRLIKGMVTQLGGTYSYTHNGGTTFTADIQVTSPAPSVLSKEKAA
jgi:two-component sensor histidine kinase